MGITSWLDARRVGIVGLTAVISSLALADAISTENHQALPVASASDDVPGPAAPDTLDVPVMSERSQSWHVARTQLREQASAEANQLAQQVAAREVAVSNFLGDVAEAMAAITPADEPEPAAAPEPVRPAAPASAAPATTAPPATSTTEAAPASGDSWSRLRQCESSGNYQNVNGSGRYRGAYQFSQTTWDWVAGIRYPHLVGVDPAAASAADQDAMAQALYELQGPGAWPSCGSAFS